MVKNLKVGDLVLNDFLKTSKGIPYIIKIVEINNDIVTYYYKGESYYISILLLRKANSFDKICGYFYNKFFE